MLAGVRGGAGKDGWFDVWEVSSPVPALQSLFCRRVQGRSRELASAVTLVLFRSAVQQRQDTGVQGQCPPETTGTTLPCGFAHSEAPLDLCLWGVSNVIEEFHWKQLLPCSRNL